MTMKRVTYLTLGCDKNRVDTERMLGALRAAGFAVTEEVEGAWALVVNTCGFIDAAKEESIEVVMEAAQEKGRGAFAVLVVGCLVERYQGELRAQSLPAMATLRPADWRTRLIFSMDSGEGGLRSGRE